MVSNPTFAGGILTNTNQHASFLRMIARGASIDIDGVYSNPAGLSFLPEDGFYLSLTGQSAYQTREITSTFPLFQAVDGEGTSRLYKRYGFCSFHPQFPRSLQERRLDYLCQFCHHRRWRQGFFLMTVCPCSVLLQWGLLATKRTDSR